MTISGWFRYNSINSLSLNQEATSRVFTLTNGDGTTLLNLDINFLKTVATVDSVETTVIECTILINTYSSTGSLV